MLQTRTKGQKSRPVPLWLPYPIYEAIRVTCIFLALDNNPNNALNNNRDPVVQEFLVSGVKVPLFCYTADLLKMWLRYLILSPLWSRTVTVTKASTSKSGAVTYNSGATTDVRCLSLPTSEEVDVAVNSGTTTGISADELKRAANIIHTLLLNVGSSSTRLFQPKETLGQVPASTQVTTPGNIVKLQRLDMIGYVKAALFGPQLQVWDAFYSSEMTRHKYILAQFSGARTTDTSIRQLSDTDKMVYNNYAVSGYTSMANQLAAYNVNDAGVHKVSQGNAVNPAIVSLQQLSLASRSSKSTGGTSNNKKYTDMIERYYRLTRHRLDAKSEKAVKNLALRLGDIAWIERQMEQYPLIQFTHNVISNRPEVLASSMQAMSWGHNNQHTMQTAQQQPQSLQQLQLVSLQQQQHMQATPQHMQAPQQQLQATSQQRPTYAPINALGTQPQTMFTGNPTIPNFRAPVQQQYHIPNQLQNMQTTQQQPQSLQQLQQQAGHMQQQVGAHQASQATYHIGLQTLPSTQASTFSSAFGSASGPSSPPTPASTTQASLSARTSPITTPTIPADDEIVDDELVGGDDE